jgi:hypothetical protein
MKVSVEERISRLFAEAVIAVTKRTAGCAAKRMVNATNLNAIRWLRRLRRPSNRRLNRQISRREHHCSQQAASLVSLVRESLAVIHRPFQPAISLSTRLSAPAQRQQWSATPAHPLIGQSSSSPNLTPVPTSSPLC